MTEQEFWRSTPRKIGTLWELHSTFNGWNVKKEKPKEKRVCIDEVSFL